jgi:plastocyanin
MPRRVSVEASLLVLAFISALMMALPLASAQSTVAVSIPSGSGSGQSAGPSFTPNTITVVIGVNNTVMWTNNDNPAGTAHTVTPKTQPAGGTWPTAGSGNIPAGQSYSFTFTVPGTYTYICSYHSWMSGTVVVLAASTSTTTKTSTTPEFPAAWLAVILFAVIAAVMVAAPRLRPTLSRGSGSVTTKSNGAQVSQ